MFRFTGDDVNEYGLDNPAVQTVCVNEAITNITYNGAQTPH